MLEISVILGLLIAGIVYYKKMTKDLANKEITIKREEEENFLDETHNNLIINHGFDQDTIDNKDLHFKTNFTYKGKKESLIIATSINKLAYINIDKREYVVVNGDEILEVDLVVDQTQEFRDNYIPNRGAISTTNRVSEIRVDISTSGTRPFFSFCCFYHYIDPPKVSEASEQIERGNKIKALVNRIKSHKNENVKKELNTLLSLSDELAKLKNLLDHGIISEMDFEKAKAKLLD